MPSSDKGGLKREALKLPPEKSRSMSSGEDALHQSVAGIKTTRRRRILEDRTKRRKIIGHQNVKKQLLSAPLSTCPLSNSEGVSQWVCRPSTKKSSSNSFLLSKLALICRQQRPEEEYSQFLYFPDSHQTRLDVLRFEICIASCRG